MATRGRIGIKQKDGTIITAYSHWDNYLAGTGYNLCEHWTNPKKVIEAIQLGNASKWGMITGDKTDFDDRNNPMHDIQNVYYGRDRGEQDQGPRTFKNEAEYLKKGFNSGEEFIYLMKQEGEKEFYSDTEIGTWYYAASTYTKDDKITPTQFKLLEEDAIRDHIEELKRHLETRKKEREVA
jgi:hypothetical protein